MSIRIRKPNSQDSKQIRETVKELGIKTYVKKSAWSINIGRQCEPFDSESAVKLIDTLKSAGYLIGQEDILVNLIKNKICDVITVQIQG